MLIGLALKALLVALIPAAFVFLSRGADRYKKLAWVTVFFTFDLIVFGAFTRLTDSGLGCPDWPGCYGEANPFLANQEIRAAEALMPTGPVTVFKAWIEMIHRYLAMGVGVLIIASLVMGWRLWRRTQESRYAPRLPAFLLFFVCLQGAFGAWTVTLKLQPVIVTMHLLLGLSLFSLLIWHAMRQSPQPPVAPLASALRVPAAIALIVAFVQIALGGWVSTNYAALACGGFPLCQGEWMPEMNFDQGFTLWRALGMTSNGEYLPFDALVAIHWVHRLFSVVVVAIVGWMAYRASTTPGIERLGRALLWLIVAQFGTGMATVLLNWPLTIAVLHNAGAALLVLLLTMLNYRLAKPAAKVAESRASHLPA
jgi:cytochrome c oxidase assembly protein subunit 15